MVSGKGNQKKEKNKNFTSDYFFPYPYSLISILNRKFRNLA